MEVESKEDSVSVRGKPRPRGYWTIENSTDEMKKYGSRSEFKRNSQGAYVYLIKNNREIIDAFFPMKQRKPAGYWNLETSIAEMKRYGSRKELEHGSPSAYQYLLKNGKAALNSFFEMKCKPNGYWTIERSLAEARKYRTRKEFRKNCSQGHCVLRKAGLLDSVFKRKYVQKGYYTREKCFGLSRLCKTRSEFGHRFYRAWRVSSVNGWLDEMEWLKVPVNLYANGYKIYIYKFEEDHSAYVGISCQLEVRDKAHRGILKHSSNSAVFKHSQETGFPVPTPEILEENLSCEEARKMEDPYIKKFRNLGWHMLNKVRGGGLGSTRKKWTDEKIEKEARKYMSKVEFMKWCSGGYQAARKKGLLGKFDFFQKPKKPRKWTIESISELIVEKKCKTLSDLCMASPGAYNRVCKDKIPPETLGLEKSSRIKREIFAFRLDGSFVGKFESLHLVGRTLGIAPGNICKFMNGDIRYVKGYVFSYDGKFPGVAKYEVSDETRKKMSESMKKVHKNPAHKEKVSGENNPRSKKVCQYTIDGIFIAEYPCTRGAERKTGINYNSIAGCCRGKHKTAGGYVWKYAESK